MANNQMTGNYVKKREYGMRLCLKVNENERVREGVFCLKRSKCELGCGWKVTKLAWGCKHECLCVHIHPHPQMSTGRGGFSLTVEEWLDKSG